VVIDAGAPLPDRNRDVFLAAATVGTAPAELVQRLADMASFRDLLVHEYDRIGPARVHAARTAGLGDLDAFAGGVVAYLQRQEGRA
jgi:uncharacterized protein YutE (UPF0331/DUF86 family)